MTDLEQTRTAYDIVAAAYAETFPSLADRPWDRTMLDALASRVSGTIADLGCGPGLAAGYLASRGVDVFGIDLSPAMVEQARALHPQLEFRVGDLGTLDIEDAALGGLVALYSIIHTPPARRPAVFSEFSRVLASGGTALVVFQMGDERRHITHGYGHDVDAYAYRLDPDAISSSLAEAGLQETARLIRQPAEGEGVTQAYLFAQKA